MDRVALSGRHKNMAIGKPGELGSDAYRACAGLQLVVIAILGLARQ